MSQLSARKRYSAAKQRLKNQVEHQREKIKQLEAEVEELRKAAMTPKANMSRDGTGSVEL